MVLDVITEKNIDDYWNVDGDRELVRYVDWFHKIHHIERKVTGWIYIYRRRGGGEKLTTKQTALKTRQIMARNVETYV